MLTLPGTSHMATELARLAMEERVEDASLVSGSPSLSLVLSGTVLALFSAADCTM